MPTESIMSSELPPQNLDAERAVLCACLLDNDVLQEIARLLTPEDFYHDAYQVIYRAISDLYSQGKAVDAVTLATELTLRDQFTLIGGHETLLEIAKSVPHARNAKYHAEIVCQKSIGRLLIQHGAETIREVYSNFFMAPLLLESAVCRLQAILPDDEPLIATSKALPDEPVEIILLRTCDYKLYLLTDHWQKIRDQTLARFGCRCAVCNSPDQLDVHHRTYERRGCEQVGDTTVLCRKCHGIFHDNGRLAKPLVDPGPF